MFTPESILELQAQLPSVQISLSQVGVTGVEKVIRIRSSGAVNGADPTLGQQLLSARFETPGLVDIITRRTAEDSVKDVGALPLLS